jgi:hypothetical protein
MTDDRKNNPQTPENTGDNSDPAPRRSSLRKILVGAGVLGGASSADKWTKPVVDSVLLPAHGQSSPPEAS